ncbi:FAD/NAD(P)-binding domain-containing protein [Xylariomycetidae sp. FL0641]|nr:FAD/NAD(P)-binding domain-containing protein [Xylariomycetidae sp. FL0641]
MEQVDCAVVGAGWYGLAAAKQFHCTQPESSLVVFDSQSSLGGTWAEERLYPGLKSNNLLGTYEYPDFPMDTPTFGVKHGEHMPGGVIHRYLTAYAEKFGIADLVRLNTKVVTAEHQETAQGGWILTVANTTDGADTSKVYARRVIFVTGLTSEPFLPHFDGQETFGGPIFHGKHFKQHRDTLDTAKAVTVFGGSKFAWDAVYAYASAGVKVEWVIRSSGHGPCWIAPEYVTPLKRWIEGLANTRFLTWFSPCVWGDADGYGAIRRLLHGTRPGRALVDGFWHVLGRDVLALNGFDAHPKTAKLKPWTPALFAGASFSLFNYETDVLALVRGPLVDVHLADIARLSPGTVHLSDGAALPADALLSHTGWKHVPPIAFLPAGLEPALGVPHFPSSSSSSSSSEEDLASDDDEATLARADAEILARFPRLRDQPVWNPAYVPLTAQRGIASADAVTPCAPLTPWVLHRFVAPAGARFLRRRDTAFAGVMSNFSNPICAHLQGLWIGAFFAGRLARDPGDEAALADLRREAVLHSRFGRWRYPTDGAKYPNFIFDAVPYLDLLQRDLGLNPHRKNGMLAEWFSPYTPRDYKDVNAEWEALQDKTKKER